MTELNHDGKTILSENDYKRYGENPIYKTECRRNRRVVEKTDGYSRISSRTERACDAGAAGDFQTADDPRFFNLIESPKIAFRSG